MVTHQELHDVQRLHQAHYLSLRARMLLKEKEVQIRELIAKRDYAAVVQEKERYNFSAKCLLESMDVLKAEYARLGDEQRESALGNTLSRILIEFENLELTLQF